MAGKKQAGSKQASRRGRCVILYVPNSSKAPAVHGLYIQVIVAVLRDVAIAKYGEPFKTARIGVGDAEGKGTHAYDHAIYTYKSRGSPYKVIGSL